MNIIYNILYIYKKAGHCYNISYNHNTIQIKAILRQFQMIVTKTKLPWSISQNPVPNRNMEYLPT